MQQQTRTEEKQYHLEIKWFLLSVLITLMSFAVTAFRQDYGRVSRRSWQRCCCLIS
jgi:hypothetical protein